jgi:hypothetical protein
MTLVDLLPQVLFALGLGFAVANILKVLELMRWIRLRSRALLVWSGRKPPYYGLMLGLGLVLGLLIMLKAYIVFRQNRPFLVELQAFAGRTFGELMMFVYYAYALPLSTRITRGFYAEGLWTDTGFMRYNQIGGISWKAGEPPTLVLISRLRMLARRLEVPGPLLGEVRRVLRDKIATHAIEIDSGPGLHLGDRDARDSV